ncbi:MAG: ABC transporter permease subunit [Actinobacteria bacterium]|nr:ABC transporter permease subunit [Actinomycetota bacterium]
MVAMFFLVPALVLLGALVLYPIFFSVFRSLYDRTGDAFIGLDNYQKMFTSAGTFIAVRNTAIWVLVVPALVTSLGLVFAVLTERISWGTAFKVVVFMPMAISFLSAGVIWRGVMWEQDPNRGLVNAAFGSAIDAFGGKGVYPGAGPSQADLLEPQGQAYVTSRTLSPGSTVEIGLFRISEEQVPEDAATASPPSSAAGDAIAGVVWLDFTRGGGGEQGVVDPTEVGLPGVAVEAVSGGTVTASATTGADGSFVLEGLLAGDYTIRLPASNFSEGFQGFTWLQSPLVTPAIMVAYIWIWAGFSMVVIGAGLAAIPRDVLEAARVDGATEWQVFRRVTVPLLAPVLAVVLVTLIINVLKVFDLVFVIAPGSAQRDANVIALEMWRASFGGARDFGLGSALSVFLFVLVLPAMAFNIRRFRTEQR